MTYIIESNENMSMYYDILYFAKGQVFNKQSSLGSNLCRNDLFYM